MCFQDLIELNFPPCPDVRDLRLAMASLGFHPHSREKIKRGALGGKREKKSQRIKNKSTGGSTSGLSEPRRLKGQWS